MSGELTVLTRCVAKRCEIFKFHRGLFTGIVGAYDGPIGPMSPVDDYFFVRLLRTRGRLKSKTSIIISAGRGASAHHKWTFSLFMRDFMHASEAG